MKSGLISIFQKTIEWYRNDPEVLAGWEYGSIGKGTDDGYSDVDPVFVVTDESFDRFHRELRPLFESLADRILLWWPEGFNSPDIVNYAILIESEGELLQYDMTLAKECSVRNGFGKVLLTGCGGTELLFDKTGIIEEVTRNAKPMTYAPDKLLWDIERYWIYVYIHVKYLKRNDTFKLLYAQQTLFGIHMEVLHALYPKAYWSWWPWSAEHVVDPHRRNDLLLYFGRIGAEQIRAALSSELRAFERDARDACSAYGLRYPEVSARGIEAYLERECS